MFLSLKAEIQFFFAEKCMIRWKVTIFFLGGGVWNHRKVSDICPASPYQFWVWSCSCGWWWGGWRRGASCCSWPPPPHSALSPTAETLANRCPAEIWPPCIDLKNVICIGAVRIRVISLNSDLDRKWQICCWSCLSEYCRSRMRKWFQSWSK